MKNIIISTDYFDENIYNREEFIKILLKNQINFHYKILTRNFTLGTSLVSDLKNNYGLNCSFLPRKSEDIGNDFEFILGNKDKDFELATNRRKVTFFDDSLFCETKIKKYGIGFSLEILNKILQIAVLNKTPYFELNLESNIKVISLINARTMYSAYSPEERLLIETFEKFLKKGIYNEYNYFIIIYIIFAIQDLNLEVPDFIFYYPSSKVQKNPIMEKIVKILRNIFHLKIEIKELFNRKYDIEASKNLDFEKRLSCIRHFKSIELEDYCLINKKVWVFDDYCTNGTSFEVVRNFLNDKELNSLTLISIGSFSKPYYRQEYQNVENFPQLITTTTIIGRTNPDYIGIIEKLSEIINS